MDIIKTSEKIYELKPKYEGSESKLYEIDGLLYKMFKTEDPQVLKNKINKLEIIHSLNIDDAKPIDLVEVNGVIRGYTMLEKNNFQSLNPIDLKRKNILFVLKKVKERLELFHKMGIVFGDLKCGNILFDGKNILFCDLDNTNIGEYSLDFLGSNQKKYLSILEADEYLDNYMLNILTLECYTHILNDFCLKYVIKKGLPHIINTKENREILERMVNLDNKEKIKPFIDNIKRYHLF